VAGQSTNRRRSCSPGSDYARAREDRKKILSFLSGEMVETAFLFVGFSLSDPNFQPAAR
jgi:hypothetical protein